MNKVQQKKVNLLFQYLYRNQVEIKNQMIGLNIKPN